MKVKHNIPIGIILPCGKVPHDCYLCKSKAANKKYFYAWYTMRNDKKIAAFIYTLNMVLN